VWLAEELPNDLLFAVVMERVLGLFLSDLRVESIASPHCVPPYEIAMKTINIYFMSKVD